MGNYYEGLISFAFKPEHSEAIDSIIDICKIMIKGSYKYNDYNKIKKDIEEYIKFNHNNFTKGLDIYRNKYGEIRKFSNSFFGIYKPKNSSRKFECYNFYEGLLDSIAELEYNNNKTEMDNLFDDINIPMKIDDVNYDSIEKAFCSVCNELYEEKTKIQYCISFHINEKGYNDDEGLTELINLWSPYLDEEFDNGFIGTIEDEDRTFRKDYYVNNIPHDNHWEFCGDWCDYYNPNVRCKDMKCRNAYNLGKNNK